MSAKDMSKYLDTLASSVRGNLKVVTRKDVQQDYMLHLSPQRMDDKLYIPRIGERQASTEDRTVPRVTVSASIFGCYIGYSTLHYNVMNYYGGKDGTPGGLHIYAIPFEFALKPTKKLVYDADVTDEHWLINYNKDTAGYKCSKVGRLFVDEVRIVPVSGTRPSVYLTVYVEVSRDDGLRFSKSVHLESGFYLITDLPAAENKDLLSKVPTVQAISKSDFMQRKKSAIALLSDTSTSLPKW